MSDDRGTTPPGGDVTPLDVDGVRAVAVGTGLWAVALVACLAFTDTLREDGHLWWIATCACGVALGLAGTVYVLRRRGAVRKAQQRQE